MRTTASQIVHFTDNEKPRVRVLSNFNGLKPEIRTNRKTVYVSTHFDLRTLVNENRNSDIGGNTTDLREFLYYISAHLYEAKTRKFIK